jgi:hypothetical protein
MHTRFFRMARRALLVGLASCCLAAVAATAPLPDHQEFEAALQVPFQAAAGRTLTMHFDYPGAAPGTPVAWRLDLLAGDGQVLRSWRGDEMLHARTAQARVRWDGGGEDGHALPAGYYTLRLRALAVDETVARAIGTGLPGQALVLATQRAPQQIQEQRVDVQVGRVAPPALPAFHALPGAHEPRTQLVAASSLPYTIYYGDLHSQTNHSDGGGELATCTGEQPPQSSAYGPADAYQYALGRGLDMLMTSEHNHMFDGSTGTNTAADPATAKNLFASGLQAAASFRAAHPNFLAVYGQEWGVISNGGHMNIFNADGLIEWEKNSAGQLIGDYEIAKGDYASLYTLMRTHGWIGQFNHPAQSGQFVVGGTSFGYTADGDAVMVLAEVLNSSAFSTNTSESETTRPNYEAAFNTLLERGFHVAPSSDQDNHCANWGASYTNRTGVLIPSGTALGLDSFLNALRARRVFATEDKTAQIVLSANGHVMGERFANSGPLTLSVDYASSSGGSAQRVQVFEGVPGRNGTVTELSQTATTTVTPAAGEHFYYAKITQADGKRLWSAPVWVSQGSGSGGDTTAPTVSAAESGSSGTITLSASASDDVGVSRVEFYVDGTLKASDSSAPYQASLDSTALADGAHTLIAKAYDAAGNVGSSAGVGFSTANAATGGDQLLANGGFESGTASWTQTSGVITSDSGEAAHAGSWKAWLDGYGQSHTDYVRQQVSIPASAASATLDFYLHIDSAEGTGTAYDTLKVQVITATGKYITLATFSNKDAASGYREHTLSLDAYKGQTLWINFYGTEDSSLQTSFVVDDVAVRTQ